VGVELAGEIKAVWQARPSRSWTWRTTPSATASSRSVAAVSDYLSVTLPTACRPDGSIEVTPHLRIAGQETVFALGDVSAAGAKMAGVGRQAAMGVSPGALCPLG
jgi:hypothetical protein